MISASEMFIQTRERDMFEGNNNFKRNEAIISEYKNGKSFKKFNSSDEEMDIRRDQEMDDRFNGQIMGGEL